MVGHTNILIATLVRKLLSMFFLSEHDVIPRDKILHCLRQVFTPNAFEAFIIVKFLIKLYFVQEKSRYGIHESSSSFRSRYNRVHDL